MQAELPSTELETESKLRIICPPAKFYVDIEGHTSEWPVSTITREQVAELGGWDPSIGVLIVDNDNNERQLQPGEVVKLEPGLGFAKKVHWKRGW
jgi:hypothetical protein